MKLSIVTTLYFSEPYLEEFYSRICAVAEKITQDFEIILVNDGSPDKSLEIAITLHERDARVKVIDLSRNFGHHKAIMTGLSHSIGDLVFLVDCDLEEEPELLSRFHEELNNSGADVVYGVQQKRKGRLFEQITGSIYYNLINFLSGYSIPKNLSTIRLMVKDYVASLIKHKDREIFLAGLWAITGYRQQPLAIEKHFKGKSAYNFGKKLNILVNSITSFSNKPLILIFYLGCMISILSGFAALYLIIRKLFFGTFLTGWPSLIVSVWMLGGLMLFCLGVIGIYLSRVFTEAKDRPYTIIRRIYGNANSETSSLPH